MKRYVTEFANAILTEYGKHPETIGKAQEATRIHEQTRRGFITDFEAMRLLAKLTEEEN